MGLRKQCVRHENRSHRRFSFRHGGGRGDEGAEGAVWISLVWLIALLTQGAVSHHTSSASYSKTHTRSI